MGAFVSLGVVVGHTGFAVHIPAGVDPEDVFAELEDHPPGLPEGVTVASMLTVMTISTGADDHVDSNTAPVHLELDASNAKLPASIPEYLRSEYFMAVGAIRSGRIRIGVTQLEALETEPRPEDLRKGAIELLNQAEKSMQGYRYEPVSRVDREARAWPLIEEAAYALKLAGADDKLRSSAVEMLRRGALPVALRVFKEELGEDPPNHALLRCGDYWLSKFHSEDQADFRFRVNRALEAYRLADRSEVEDKIIEAAMDYCHPSYYEIGLAWLELLPDEKKDDAIEVYADRMLTYWKSVRDALEVYDSIGREPAKGTLKSIGEELIRRGNLSLGLLAYEACSEKPSVKALTDCGQHCLRYGMGDTGLHAFKLAKKEPSKDLLHTGAMYLIKGGYGYSDDNFNNAMRLFSLAGKEPPSDELRTFARRALEGGNLELGIKGFRRLGEPISVQLLIRIADQAVRGNDFALAMRYYQAAALYE